MEKKYFYIILFSLLLFSLESFSQEEKTISTNTVQEISIEGLTIYPNPVSTGKIYISSKSSLDKKIEIFDVLGKKVLETTITTKEVNVANLSPGIYIIKIKEKEASATRKLIIN
uniref:T9SS type A sorting domain-containing protein n=1 Tax=Flavobacterium sp. TaxID=239 RepID=UPI00404AB95C